MPTEARSGERGFTMVEVLVAIVVTALAVSGVASAVLGAMRAQNDADSRASLDDDALAALSDVRMMTAYDPKMLQKLEGRTATMTRTLPSGERETISVSISGLAGTAALVDSTELATAAASSGALTATERIALFQHAPEPGSVVDQQ